MTDEELIASLRGKGFSFMEKAADRIEALTAKVKLMDDLDVINGEKIEALTEQLEAARADAKEAEAYAEELEKELNLMKTAGIVEVAIRNPSVMEYMKHWEGRVETAEAKLATCEKYRDAYAECDKIGTQAVRDLEDKLAKAVEGLRDAVDAWDNHDKTGDMMQGYWVTDARATLAEIEGEKR
jgi:chromosome segregation ATPase